MKKILLILIVVAAATFTSNAQSWSWGPKVGASFATANGVESAKVRAGVVAGLFAESAVNNWLVMQADLLFTQQGFDVKGDPKTRYRVDFLSMPIVGKYYLTEGLSFQLGAQFGYLLGAKEKIEKNRESVRWEFNKYNISFISGMAYDFDMGLVIEGRYLYGLTPFMSTDSATRSCYLQITAGWRF